MEKKKRKINSKTKIPDIDATMNTITYMRLVQGKSKYTIVRWLMKEYSISIQRAYELIRQMEAKVIDIYKDEMKDHLALAISKFEAIQELAFQNNNLKVAIEAEKEISKIKGLYIVRIETTTKEDIPMFSDDDIDLQKEDYV